MPSSNELRTYVKAPLPRGFCLETDLYLRVWLAVALFLVVAGLLPVADDDLLFVSIVFEDDSCDFRASNIRRADFDGITVCSEEDLIEAYFFALIFAEELNRNDVPVFDEVLLRAR